MVTRSTQYLMDEHRTIETVTQALRQAAERLEAQGEVNRDLWPQAVDFVRFFSDTFHHAKEEQILFKYYSEKGLPMDDGPVKQMLDDHHESRMIVDRLEEMATSLVNGNGAVAPMVARHAREYAELLNAHIQKEDLILYPMGENLMTEQEDAQLIARFEAAELQLGGPPVKQRYKTLATDLLAMVS